MRINTSNIRFINQHPFQRWYFCLEWQLQWNSMDNEPVQRQVDEHHTKPMSHSMSTGALVPVSASRQDHRSPAQRREIGNWSTAQNPGKLSQARTISNWTWTWIFDFRLAVEFWTSTTKQNSSIWLNTSKWTVTLTALLSNLIAAPTPDCGIIHYTCIVHACPLFLNLKYN